jgi:hypothetical protein
MALDMGKSKEVREQTFQDMCDEIVALQSGKAEKYKDSPFNILPKQYWLSQVAVKAVRAEQCLTDDMAEEELLDVAVYSLLTILKLRGMKIK